jgi:hypothetical protein
MKRKFKALALTLAAMFVIGGIMASMAMAEEEGTITSDGPVSLVGTNAPGTETTFRAFGMETKCTIKYTIGNLKETPHKFVTPPVLQVTVKPDTIKCKSKVGETSELPTTVTGNGCDFTRVFPFIKPGKWKMKSKLSCEGGAETIEFHVYTSAAHTTSICTVKVPPQENLEGGTAENISGGKITFGGTTTGIKASKTGILCGGAAETSSGEEEADVEVTGANEAGGATEVSLS